MFPLHDLMLQTTVIYAAGDMDVVFLRVSSANAWRYDLIEFLLFMGTTC